MNNASPTSGEQSLSYAPLSDAGSVAVRPVRVLHVLEATLGGTLRYLENIGQSMEASPFVFGFAYGESRADSRLKPFLETVRRQGWSTFPIDMQRTISLGNEVQSVLALRKVIREFRPDILHCHSSKAGVTGRVAAYTTSPKPTVLYSPHAVAVPLGRKYLYIERALRWFTQGFVAVSPSEADDLVRYGLCSRESLRIVNPAIDTRYFKPRDRDAAKMALGLGDQSIVLAIGRMTSQKNPLGFLEIFRRVKAAVPDAKAIWMGEGELLPDFISRAAEMHLESDVQVVPWQHDIRPYLAAADVLLGTSIYESFGYMIAEALAMEVPVVSTAVSGPRDILTGPLAENMYEPGDVHKATELVTRLLCHEDHAAYHRSTGRPLIEERFSKEAMREALIQCYKTVLS